MSVLLWSVDPIHISNSSLFMQKIDKFKKFNIDSFDKKIDREKRETDNLIVDFLASF